MWQLMISIKNHFFTPNDLLAICQKKRFIYGKSTYYLPYGDENVGQTLYLRKPSDDERLRIYDKQAEQASNNRLVKRNPKMDTN